GDEPVRALSAVTLVTADMARAVATYQRLGFAVVFGGARDAFTTLQAGAGFVNLQRLEPGASVPTGWGRIVVHVDDVDA
ncbi:VOC family protein, partial [Enterococcus faecalis]|uniref:VOC family protein n=1 Tax=Enterococcus faecalis TaxID=1351 RepID=UPI0040393C25